MADTSFLTNNALTVKLWDEKLRRGTLKSLFFTKMMGDNADSIIQVDDKLVKGKGDTVTIGLRIRSTAAGQTSSTTGIALEGNEEAMTFYNDSVSLSEYGNAVKLESELTEQRTAFDLRTEAKSFLQDWATEKLERLIATSLVTSPSTNRILDKSSTACALADIQALHRKAKLASVKLRPVTIDGKKYFVMLAHPYAIKGLLADSNFTTLQREARERGTNNPLIQGANYIVDGVLIYEYDRDELLLSGNQCRSLLLGAQAGYVAWSKKPSWHEKLFDYNTKYGAAVKMIMGVKKTVFNSEDYGVIALDNAYTPDA